MESSSFADKVQVWNVLTMNLEPLLGEVEHARPAHGQLQEVIAEMRVLSERMEAQRASTRTFALRRQALTKEGRKLRNVLAAILQGHFGLDSSELIKFGLKPRLDGVRRPRKPKGEGEAAAEVSSS
ncbi:MAG TPA: hypothetical protein VN783_15950 [Thermoanaerobaculia bacterium]|nr:hypothetical protein [Thermoanaerobaculia bacterium]